MRGDADSPGGPPPLNWQSLAPDARIALGTGLVSILVAAFTGALSSPFLLLPALWLAVIPHTSLRERWPLLTIGTVLLLALANSALQEWSVSHVVAAGMLLVTGAAFARWHEAHTWDTSVRLARLDRILTEAHRDEPLPTAETRATLRLEELQSALELVRTRSGGRRAVLWEVIAEQDRVRLLAASSSDVESAQVALTGSPLGWLFQEGQPLGFDAGAPISATPSPVRAIRLTKQDGHGLLLTVDFAQDTTPTEPTALRAIAAPLHALIELQNERLKIAESRDRVSFLLDALRRIPHALDTETFANALLADAVRITSATGGAIGIWREDKGRILSTTGDDGGPRHGAAFEPAESVLAMAARANATMMREAPAEPERSLAIAAPGEIWTQPPRAVAAIPLFTNAGVMGVIGIWSSQHLRFDPEAIAMLETLAPFAALQLERALEFGRVRDTAERDPLTGLANRRVFDREIAAESARFDRYGRPFSLVMVDVDHFKAVNDRHGHETGDAVLRAVADVMRAGVRHADLAARIGGEEFAVLLPETQLPAAADIAERLRRTVEALAVKASSGDVPVTLSAGVSACPECVRVPHELLRSADAALYRAKEEGRNRVLLASSAG